MDTSPIEFTPGQWEFISIIKAFDEAVPINVLGELVPLPPGEFLDLLKKIERIDWFHRLDNDCFDLDAELPKRVAEELDTINDSGKIEHLIRQIDKKKPALVVSPRAYVGLLEKAGKEKKALAIRIDLCITALKQGSVESAKHHLLRIDDLVRSIGNAVVDEMWFVPKTLELSNLCIPRAIGLTLIPAMLENLIRKVETIGDERSWAVANLMLGRYYWATNRMKDSVRVMAGGKKKVEELGDSDMMTYSSNYIGIYYFIRGLQNKAIPYLEKAVEYMERNEEGVSFFEAPILLAYCDVDRGEFHRAIGKIDFFRHCALRRDDYFIASLYRAVLGILLWLVRKRKEAVYHLEGSQTDALASQNTVAYWTSLYGLAVLYLMDGEIEQGLLFLNKTIELADDIGMGHQIFHSIFLESYYLAEKSGGKLPRNWRFSEQFKRIMEEPNIHTRGAALRIDATRRMADGCFDADILNDLEVSESLLTTCNDPVELAKTKLEKTRYFLKHRDTATARELAYEAYQKMSGYSEIYFPDDLRFLLGDSAVTEDFSRQDGDDIIEPFVQMMEELIPKPQDLRELDMLLAALSRFFRAERSGLFTFAQKKKHAFELRAARNLSQAIVEAESFRRSLSHILKAHRTKKPIVIQSRQSNEKAAYKSALSILILPLVIENEVIGILYFDNSYLDNCFDFIKTKRLNRLGHHLTSIVEKYLRFPAPQTPMVEMSAAKPTQAVLPDRSEFISRDRKMIGLLNQAKKQAQTDASILILGETGVGKDLLARWIHRHSLRSQRSFVVVDLTTIPENLMESELFGHEKGSFTGADRQKIGRVELADRGTLFVDEIGEISRDLQVKLLRLLQEKKFLRIGGTNTLFSDFRLIAASNRDLTEEIRAGRFREDLYYRLNVLELTIPPLRKRKDDILPLAEYYLAHYKKKYAKTYLAFTTEQKDALVGYHWPGNVRELKNLIERAVIVADNRKLELIFSFQSGAVDENPFSDFPTLDQIQRRYIRFVLEHTNGRIGGAEGAANILGMKRTSVNSRMKKLNVQKPGKRLGIVN
ncbi:MAG: sigma 54-interacting transcriptional regulator [Desulfobacterales bacterium]